MKKKNLKIFSIAIFLFLGLMILQSCEKNTEAYDLLNDAEKIKQANKSQTAGSRSLDEDITEITTPDEANEAVAIALSKAVHESEAVRQFILNSSEKNEIRHKELLLGLIGNEIVSEGKSFGQF